MITVPFFAWAGRGLAVVAALAAASSAFAAPVLFPTPLHLVRRVEDPLSSGVITLDEYCAGNRIVTVNGPRVAIVDYDKQTLTEIDRTAGTYSVTTFDAIAKAQPPAPRVEAQNARVGERWTPRAATNARATAGRALESFSFEDQATKTRVDVGVDRSVRLAPAAVEALIGASYPNSRRDEHEPLLRAARAQRGSSRIAVHSASSATEEAAGLPAEQTITWESADGAVTMRNSIVRVTADAVPPELLLIDPAYTRVESRHVRIRRELDELDRLPSEPAKP